MIILLEKEEIIENYIGMVGYEGPSISTFSLRNGSTVLTNKRLIFLRSRLGTTSYDSIEKIEKDLQKKDSFSVDRESITGVYSDIKLRVPYLTLEYKEGGETKYASFAAADLNYDLVIKLLLMFRRKVRERDPDYVKTRQRDQILIDQTHGQQDIIHQTIVDVIRSSAIEQDCEDLLFITDSRSIPEERKRTWNKALDLLKDTAIFASIGTQRDKFNPEDLDILKDYVQDGGTLFITPDPKKKPPNNLTEVFGFSFGEKAILDRKNHGVFRDHIIVRDFQDHPANKDIESIMFGDNGCYPIILDGDVGVPIAISSPDSNPPNSTVAAEIPYGEGRILAVGQCRIFMDDYLGEENNFNWLENMMNYALSTDKNVTVIPTTSEHKTQETKHKTKFCSNCGNQLDPDDLFCGNCGQKISESL
jgi:hypothetical protein